MTSVGEDTLSVEEKARRLYRGVLCAPMVRASTTPLRVLALQYGADAVYTEELVDRAITNTIRNTSGQFTDYIKDTSNCSAKTLKKMARDKHGPAMILRIDPKFETGKIICQLGTADPALALKAAQHVVHDVHAIDINMGCPKKFSVGGGMGSALLQDPQRAATIIRTLRQALPTTPVSCKIRLLQNTQNTLHFCHQMVQAGVLAIAIHGRRVGMLEQDAADWDTLKQVVIQLKQSYPKLPVLVNGDFYTRQEFTDFIKHTGADGVLLARPALYNTSIFRNPTTQTTTSFGYDSPLLLDKTTVIQHYLRLCLRYNTHYKNVKYVVCEMMTNRRAPTDRSFRLTQQYPAKQTIGKVCQTKSTQDLCQLFGLSTTDLAAVVATEQKHITKGDEEKKDNDANDGEAPAAGEHRYEDSYFLKHETNKRNQQQNQQQNNNNHHDNDDKTTQCNNEKATDSGDNINHRQDKDNNQNHKASKKEDVDKTATATVTTATATTTTTAHDDDSGVEEKEPATKKLKTVDGQ